MAIVWVGAPCTKITKRELIAFPNCMLRELVDPLMDAIFTMRTLVFYEQCPEHNDRCYLSISFISMLLQEV